MLSFHMAHEMLSFDLKKGLTYSTWDISFNTFVCMLGLGLGWGGLPSTSVNLPIPFTALGKVCRRRMPLM